MNKHIYKGKWKQLRGKVTQNWGKVTNNRRTKMNGEYVEFTGRVQEKYGFSLCNARKKYQNFLKRHNLNRKMSINKRNG